MNEVKIPKEASDFLLHCGNAAVLMLFNFMAMPWLSQHQIKEVDYNTFVTMTEQSEIGQGGDSGAG